MVIGIHQPNYLPYLGFFDKIRKSDIFVILDDAQFSKGDFHNRNRIKTSTGAKWITIPVLEAFKPINDTLINYNVRYGKHFWNEHHLMLLNDNYKNTPYFDTIFPGLVEIYSQQHEKLAVINIQLIKLICKYLNISTSIYFSSGLNLKTKSTLRLVEICEHFNADTYLSGQDGPKYMDMNLFKNRNIEVVVQNFIHPVYNQLYKGFIPYLSALDKLFNIGNS